MIDLTHEELVTARRAALGASIRYRKYVDKEDVEQELKLWMLEHEEDLLRWRHYTAGLKALHRSLMRVAHRYCEREKAVRVGYKSYDNSGYSPALLRELLKDALRSDWSMVTGVEGTPHSAVGIGIIDTRRGLKMLRPKEAEVLALAVQTNYDYDRMAELESTEEYAPSHEAMRKRVDRALRKLSSALSWPREEEAERAEGKFDPFKTIPRRSDTNVLRGQLGEAA